MSVRSRGGSAAPGAAARIAVLSSLRRLVRLDRDRHRAVVESATSLPDDLRDEVQASLARLYGSGLATSFETSPGADRRDAHQGRQRRLRRQRARTAGRPRITLVARVTVEAITMADLVQEIEAEIADAKTATARQTVGVIREIGDGVAKVEGLADVMLNEMLDFGNGITGLALNLEETEVGVIILGDYTQLAGGRRGPRHRQAAAGAGRQGAARPRREHARRAARRQGADRSDHDLSGREAGARHHQAAPDRPAGADRHHGRSTR